MISAEGVPEEFWDAADTHFRENKMPTLLMVISVINVWNRLVIATHQKLPDLPD